MKRRAVILWCCGILCWIVSLIITGYNAGASNKPIQLALVHLLRDPSLYPNDPVRDTLYRYSSTLWWLIARLPESVPLDVAEGMLFLVTRALLIYSAYRLAYALYQDSLLAQVSAMCLMGLVPHPQIGGGTILDSYFEQTSASIPFILLGAAAFLEKRTYQTTVWLGMAFNMTLIYASFALVYLGAAVIAVPQLRVDWKRLFKSLVLFGICASPTLLLVARYHSTAVFDAELWYHVQRIRSPFHLFPLYFPLLSWTKYSVSVALALMLFVIVGKHRLLWKQLGFAWTAISVFFVLWAFVPAYLLKSPLLLVLQTARASDVWACLVGILTVVSASYLVERNLPTVTKRSVLAVGVWLLFLNVWSLKSHPTSIFIMGAVVGAGAWLILSLQKREQFAADMLIPLTLVSVAVVGFLRWHLHPPDFKLYKDSPIFPFARWTYQNTSREALFLIPPGDQDAWPLFRALSQRSVFVTWKDGTNVFFAPEYAHTWTERIEAIGVNIRGIHLGLRTRPLVDSSNVNNLYERLSDKEVQRLAAQYGVTHWVVSRDKHSSFQTVFAHGKWKVLQVVPPPTSTTPTSQPRRESQR